MARLEAAFTVVVVEAGLTTTFLGAATLAATALTVVGVGLTVVGAEAFAGRQTVRPGNRAVDVRALFAANRSLSETLTFLAISIQ